MIKQESADYWIKNLHLIPHPEGGFFKEIYRSGQQIDASALQNGQKGSRNISTAIYYLLQSGDFSSFHRIKSDELWHFYYGASIALYIIDEEGKLTTKYLGGNLQEQQLPVVHVPKNAWFAAEVVGSNSFVLAGCTVAPGFDFEDFEMGNRQSLINAYPEYAQLIIRLTRLGF